MNPPIPKSICEEEMQNAGLDTNVVIVEYITDAHGNKVKKLKPLLIKSEPDKENMFITCTVTITYLLYTKTISCKRER